MPRDIENKRRINRRLYEANKARNAHRDVRGETPWKVCCRCGQRKPSSQFHLRPGNRDGLNSSCAACKAATDRRDYVANREKRLATNRAWRKKNRARARAGWEKWYAANREARRAYGRRWYRRNSERVRAAVAEWQRANPERKAEYQRRRRAATGGVITEAVLLGRFAIWGDRCWICGSDEALTVDHVKPIAKGGAHLPCNLRPACRPCNSAKRDRWPFIPEVVSADA